MMSGIAIVGAGPAGLTAAVALRRLGLEVTVFEQAEDFQRIGGGIVLHDNGQQVLEALGLLNAFRPHLQPCPVIAAELCRGKALGAVDFGRFSPPLRHLPAVVLRHQLQEHLLAAARAAGVEVRFGHRVVTASAAGEGPCWAWPTAPASAPASCWPATAPAPRPGPACGSPRGGDACGGRICAAWPTSAAAATDPRAVVPDGRIFGLAPLPGACTYFWCTAPPGRWPPDPPRWPGGVDRILGRPSEAGAVLGAVGDWSRVNYDEPLEVQARRWYCTPVFLVGDAAHAMTPYLGQGANSALVDALVLARLLAQELQGHRDLAAVGRRYVAIRGRFTRLVQASSHRQGDLATLGWAPARRLRDRLLSQLAGAG